MDNELTATAAVTATPNAVQDGIGNGDVELPNEEIPTKAAEVILPEEGKTAPPAELNTEVDGDQDTPVDTGVVMVKDVVSRDTNGVAASISTVNGDDVDKDCHPVLLANSDTTSVSAPLPPSPPLVEATPTNEAVVFDKPKRQRKKKEPRDYDAITSPTRSYIKDKSEPKKQTNIAKRGRSPRGGKRDVAAQKPVASASPGRSPRRSPARVASPADPDAKYNKRDTRKSPPSRRTSPKVSRGNSPKGGRGGSPKGTRGASPRRIPRAESPRSASPKGSDGASPRGSRTCSPKNSRVLSPKGQGGLSPKGPRAASPKGGPQSPKCARTQSPKGTKKPSPKTAKTSTDRSKKVKGKAKTVPKDRKANCKGTNETDARGEGDDSKGDTEDTKAKKVKRPRKRKIADEEKETQFKDNIDNETGSELEAPKAKKKKKRETKKTSVDDTVDVSIENRKDEASPNGDQVSVKPKRKGKPKPKPKIKSAASGETNKEIATTQQPSSSCVTASDSGAEKQTIHSECAKAAGAEAEAADVNANNYEESKLSEAYGATNSGKDGGASPKGKPTSSDKNAAKAPKKAKKKKVPTATLR